MDFQVPRFPDFQKSGLGQAWAVLGPGLAGPEIAMVDRLEADLFCEKPTSHPHPQSPSLAQA